MLMESASELVIETFNSKYANGNISLNNVIITDKGRMLFDNECLVVADNYSEDFEKLHIRDVTAALNILILTYLYCCDNEFFVGQSQDFDLSNKFMVRQIDPNLECYSRKMGFNYIGKIISYVEGIDGFYNSDILIDMVRKVKNEKWDLKFKYKKVSVKDDSLSKGCYDVVGEFFEGFAVISVDGKWGFINEEGVVVCNPIYDWADDFDEGLAVVKVGEKYGIVNKQFHHIIDPEYNNISWNSSNNVIIASKDGKWWLKNRDGSDVSLNKYKWCADFYNDLALVRSMDGMYGYIDRSGEFVLLPIYHEATSFDGGYAEVEMISGESVIINTKGKILKTKYH